MFLGNIKLLSTQLAMIADRLDFYIVNTLGNPAGASIGYTNCITSTGTLMVIVPLLILYLFAQKGFVERCKTQRTILYIIPERNLLSQKVQVNEKGII